MNLVGWNSRGLGNPRTVRVLGEMVISLKHDLLFLSKTLLDGNNVEALDAELGYVNFFSVDRQGKGGGLAVFWKRTIKYVIIDSSPNHIDIEVKEGGRNFWRLTCFDDFPERERCQESWDFLRSLASRSELP